MSLDEFEEKHELLAELTRSRRKLAKQRADLDIARALAKDIGRERDDAVARLGIYETAANLEPPKWLTPKKPKKSTATVCALLSDCHWDEIVKISEVPTNAYNRKIAEMRLKRFCNKVISLAYDQTAGVTVDGLVLMLGGDMVTGSLHDSAQHNETPYGPVTCAHWATRLAAAIEQLSEAFPKVHVVNVVGNHGRLTIKPRTNGRARDSWDWLLVHSAQKQLEHLKNVTWQIPETHDAMVRIHNTKFLLTHGDTVSGGGGIGGIWPPIKRMQARLQVNQPHDILVMGHWHQLVQAGSGQSGLIVNGSLKGFDSYARISGFSSEPAQQAWWLVTPEHGVTMQAPIFVADPKAEGWG